METKNLNSNWYVAYTYPKAEKRVQTRVRELGIDSFLPLRKVRKKWSDRVKIIEEPLFLNYIFIKTAEKNIPDITDIEGVVRFISFGGKFATIRNEEIEMIRKAINRGTSIKVENETLEEGQFVKITEGPFEGMEGILIRQQGNQKFIIALDGLAKQISIEVPVKYLETRVSSIGA